MGLGLMGHVICKEFDGHLQKLVTDLTSRFIPNLTQAGCLWKRALFLKVSLRG